MKAKAIKDKAKLAILEYKARLIRKGMSKYYDNKDAIDVMPAIGKLLGVERWLKAEKELEKYYNARLPAYVKESKVGRRSDDALTAVKRAKLRLLSDYIEDYAAKDEELMSLHILFNPKEKNDVKYGLVNNCFTKHFCIENYNPLRALMVREVVGELISRGEEELAADILSLFRNKFAGMPALNKLIAFNALIDYRWRYLRGYGEEEPVQDLPAIVAKEMDEVPPYMQEHFFKNLLLTYPIEEWFTELESFVLANQEMVKAFLVELAERNRNPNHVALTLRYFEEALPKEIKEKIWAKYSHIDIPLGDELVLIIGATMGRDLERAKKALIEYITIKYSKGEDFIPLLQSIIEHRKDTLREYAEDMLKLTNLNDSKAFYALLKKHEGELPGYLEHVLKAIEGNEGDIWAIDDKVDYLKVIVDLAPKEVALKAIDLLIAHSSQPGEVLMRPYDKELFVRACNAYYNNYGYDEELVSALLNREDDAAIFLFPLILKQSPQDIRLVIAHEAKNAYVRRLAKALAYEPLALLDVLEEAKELPQALQQFLNELRGGELEGNINNYDDYKLAALAVHRKDKVAIKAARALQNRYAWDLLSYVALNAKSEEVKARAIWYFILHGNLSALKEGLASYGDKVLATPAVQLAKHLVNKEWEAAVKIIDEHVEEFGAPYTYIMNAIKGDKEALEGFKDVPMALTLISAHPNTKDPAAAMKLYFKVEGKPAFEKGLIKKGTAAIALEAAIEIGENPYDCLIFANNTGLNTTLIELLDGLYNGDKREVRKALNALKEKGVPLGPHFASLDKALNGDEQAKEELNEILIYKAFLAADELKEDVLEALLIDKVRGFLNAVVERLKPVFRELKR